MELEAQHCKICGGTLTKKGDGEYICDYNPTHVFKEKSITEQREQMLSLFGEALYKQKEEQVANIRSNLYEAVHEEFTDSKKVIGYCRELKKLMSDDFQANFYETANGKNLRNINKILDGIDVEKQRYHIDDIVEFMLKSLESRNVSSLKNLIDRAYRTYDSEKYTKYISLAEEEAYKLEEGIYEAALSRDVFVAYSSADMAEVNKITEYLESEGISCFVALRNLRHGKGAVENYENLLKTAMHNCKCVVFISSENSRNLSCDALTVELTHIKEYEPQLGRIEYVIEDYKNTSAAAKILLEEFFEGLEHCRTEDDLLRRVLKYKTVGNKNRVKTNVKYCLTCGEENPSRAKLCMSCGKSEFVATYRDYLDVKAEEERKRRQEEFQREKEKLQKAQEEELARRQHELEKQQEEKIASERAELEAQKKELLRKQEELEEQLRKKLEAEYSAKLTEKAARPKPEESDYPTLENYDKDEFEIEDGNLISFNGENKEIKIPKGVTTISFLAFCEITDDGYSANNFVKKITIPESVISFSKSTGLDNSAEIALANCTALESISVLKGNTVYHSDGNCLIETQSKTLIAGCKNSIIPKDGSVKNIAIGAFRGCAQLEKITIPEGVTLIAYKAFYECKRLKNISLPNSIIAIEPYAFDECDNLLFNEYGNAYYLGNNSNPYLALIKKRDDSVATITLNNDTKLIAYEAFKDSEFFDLSAYMDRMQQIRNGQYEGKADDAAIFLRRNPLKEIIAPNGLERIGDCAFAGCNELSNITIPDSVISIGESAFIYCRELKNVTMPEELKPFIDSAFGDEKEHINFKFTSGYPTLENYDKNEFEIEGTVLKKYLLKDKKGEVKIPQGVTKIDFTAFWDCGGLTSIIIPNSVTAIDDRAFNDCGGLESITVSEGNKIYYSKDNCVIEKENKTLILGCKNSVISSDGSVTSIGEGAFDGCSGLTSIIIPNSVTTIDDFAFNDCSGLESITVSEGNEIYYSKDNCVIEKESKTLILGCKNSVIPSDGSVTSIGDEAFSGCSGLTSITIPNNVTSIGKRAFYGCSGLKSIKALNKVAMTRNKKLYVVTEAENIIPNSVKTIGDYAFAFCRGLENITIPVSVTSIGDKAFFYCSGLESVAMPRKLKSRIKAAFDKEKKHIKFTFTR